MLLLLLLSLLFLLLLSLLLLLLLLFGVVIVVVVFIIVVVLKTWRNVCWWWPYRQQIVTFHCSPLRIWVHVSRGVFQGRHVVSTSRTVAMKSLVSHILRSGDVWPFGVSLVVQCTSCEMSHHVLAIIRFIYLFTDFLFLVIMLIKKFWAKAS